MVLVLGCDLMHFGAETLGALPCFAALQIRSNFMLGHVQVGQFGISDICNIGNTHEKSN